MLKFVTSTYQELLKKFLGGRGASSHSLNQQFFVKIFEECDFHLGKSLMKPLLRYLLPAGSADEKLADSEISGVDGEKSGSRSQHQRMLAIEIFNSLVRASQKNSELLKVLAQNLDLITSVLITVLQTADTWKDKKVKKSMLALNIFTKLAKNLVMSKSEKIHNASIAKNGNIIIKEIEAQCEKDKSFANLKGKIKEIQKIMEHS